MITFHQGIEAWAKEAKKTKDNLDRMRLWINWACQIRPSESEAIEKFTDMVEGEVFGYGHA